MSQKRCPTQEELLGFVDADLAPEPRERVEQHLAQCSQCAAQVQTLRELIVDIQAPLPPQRFEVEEHVAAVMKRLDTPVRRARGASWTVWGGALLAAAAVALLVLPRGQEIDGAQGRFTARGNAAESSLSRDVGLQLYAQEASLRPLTPGSQITAHTRLTAGLRNLAEARAYLLLFAVDAEHVVHWITPQFTDPQSDPEAASIEPASNEQLLPSAVVFDDLAPGPLRIVALITRTPTHVSAIERLSAQDLSGERLMARFSLAEIRQIRLEVTP